VENLPTGQKIVRLAAVELLIAAHDVVETAKIIQVPQNPTMGGDGFRDREVMRGVVDMVNAERGFAFVITHKGRVFMGLSPQLAVAKGSVVEFTVGQSDKVSADIKRLARGAP
jgi:hypothetical protein